MSSSPAPPFRLRPWRRATAAVASDDVRARRDSRVACWFVAATAALLLLGFQGDRMYADTLMDLYSGRYVWQHGLPHTDPFTVAGAGRPWIDGQWLANLIFYGAWKVGGLWLVGKLSVACLVAGLVLLARYLRWRGASFGVQALAPLGALVVSLPALFPRAQNIVVPLFVALIWIVMDAERAERPMTRRTFRSIAALTALLVLWGNLHGSSAMAVGLTFAYASYRCLRLLRAPDRRGLATWGSLLVIAPATMLVTPYGRDTFEQYRLALGNSEFHRYISEWAPIWRFVGLVQGGPAIVLALVAGIVAVRRGRAICVPLAGCVVILTLATVAEVRYSLWLGIAAAALLAEGAGARSDCPRVVSSRVRLATGAVALVWTCALCSQLVGTGDARALTLMPGSTVQAAYAAARAHPGLTVLGDLDSSALMLWAHPDMRGRVEFDSRQEIFRGRGIDRWYSFQRVQGAGWFSLAARDGIVLASRQWSGDLVRQLERPRAGWTVTSTDDGAVLVRSPG